MKILVLAAGYGTRLYSLVKDTPKPLLLIDDRPLIDYILDKFKVIDGINEIIVVTNDKFYSHFLDWADRNNAYPCPIKVVNDGTSSPDDRLGSVGDINFVIKNCNVEDDLLVIGGDNLFDYSLNEYVEFAQKKNPHVTIGVYDIKNLDEASKFGVVEVDEEGRIVSFEEKPESPKSSLIAMCFYYFPKESLGFVENYLQITHKADKAGDYIHWLTDQKGVYGFKFQGKWYDIGSVESYQKAQEKFKN
jgi:glucose-1-phosphate thymidylyltransferase